MSALLLQNSVYQLQVILNHIFQAQAREIMSRLTLDRIRAGDFPDMSHWTQIMAQACRPTLLRQWQMGMIRSARNVEHLAAQRGQQVPAAKSLRWALGKAGGRSITPRFGALSFDLVNPRVMDAVDNLTLIFCQTTNATATDDLETSLTRVRSFLAEGLSEGQAYRAVAAEVFRIFAEPTRATMIAITETNRASNQGALLSAAESELDLLLRWQPSSRACDRCLDLEGEEVKPGEPFIILPGGGPYAVVTSPPLHPRCCSGVTPIRSPRGIAWIKSFYDGPIVQLDLGIGGRIGVTPAHMLLSSRGFLRAIDFVQGDDVIRYCGSERINSGNPNDDRNPSTAQEVFDSRAVSLGVSTRSVPIAAEYLHGDATFCKGDIHVVTSDRFLMHERYPTLPKPIRERLFERTDSTSGQFSGESDLASVLFALRDATDGGMGSRRELAALFLGELRVLEKLGLSHCSDMNASGSESKSNDVPGNVESYGDGLFRFSRFVKANQFVNANTGVESDTPSFASRPYMDAGRNETPFDYVARDAETGSDGNSGFASGISANNFIDRRKSGCLEAERSSILNRKIETCRILDVRVEHYRGPVYDISDETTMYILGNGIVSSNCECVTVDVLA